MNGTYSVTAPNNINFDPNKATYTNNNIAYSRKYRGFLEDRKPGYLTEDEFFEIVLNAYKSTYSFDGVNHPGDLYVNFSSVLEIVSNTLNSLVDLNHGRDLRDVTK
jgi:hypothetical protein